MVIKFCIFGWFCCKPLQTVAQISSETKHDRDLLILYAEKGGKYELALKWKRHPDRNERGQKQGTSGGSSLPPSGNGNTLLYINILQPDT